MRNYTGPPVTGDDFFGRAKELKKMGDLLVKGMSIFIPGPRRIGKTSLAQEFMRQNDKAYRFIYFDLEGKQSLLEFCEDLLREMKSKQMIFKDIWDTLSGMFQSVEALIAEVRLKKLEFPLKDVMRMCEDILKRLTKENMVLVLDEFSDFLFHLSERREVELFLSWLRSLRHKNYIRMIVTGSVNIISTVEELNCMNYINDLPPVAIQPLTRDEVRDLITELLKEKNILLKGKAQSFVLDKLTDGIPFYLQLFADKIMDEHENMEITDLKEIKPFYLKLIEYDYPAFIDMHDRLNRYLEEKERKIAITLLSYISDKPLALKDLFPYIEESTTDIPFVHKILKRLVDECYLSLNKGIYSFVSPILREWWQHKYEYEREMNDNQ
ncbi:MAG: AAA family ATPase [Spirochaetales bacterium]|nr:AAA family ATPase [Spirochaetales bacterium]